MLLLMGDTRGSPLFLQIKEAQESVLAPYAGASIYEHQGERVVAGQRLMQAAGDPFLGWTTAVGSDRATPKQYYVRQLRDMKGDMDIPGMKPRQLERYAALCGWALARAHARTGTRPADRRVSRWLGSLRPRDRVLLPRLRRPERRRPRSGCTRRRRGRAPKPRRVLRSASSELLDDHNTNTRPGRQRFKRRSSPSSSSKSRRTGGWLQSK